MLDVFCMDGFAFGHGHVRLRYNHYGAVSFIRQLYVLSVIPRLDIAQIPLFISYYGVGFVVCFGFSVQVFGVFILIKGVSNMSLCSIIRASDDKAAFTDFSFVKDLNLAALFDFRAGAKYGEKELRIENYFTRDTDVIRMRQDLFTELLDKPELYARLKKNFFELGVLFDLQTAKSEVESAEVMLLSVLELESYIAYMDDIRNIFSEYDVKSELLRGLWDTVKPLCTGDGYEHLKKEVNEQACSVRNIRSITVGVNLDPQLRVTEAGVVSINEKSFVSGELIDRILRLDMKKDEYTCISPFYPVNKKAAEQETGALRLTVNSVLSKVYASALRSWSHTVKGFIISSLRDLTAVAAEWRFISVCTDALIRLKQKGYPLCRAQFGEEDRITGMYHPVLALLSDTKEKRVVKNDLYFGSDAGIYILTGPNQGGKSIFTQATGILYAMLHLGLPLPAQNAVVRPVDAILTHFIDAGKISYQHGRLASECDRIYKINQSMSKDSLVLFDEALSSTNPTEAVAISEEIIKAYAEIGIRGIWATHFHELCRLVKDETNGKSRICNLTAVLDNKTHERQFRIVPGDGSEQSYAADIAGKYNLSKDEIIKVVSYKKV